MATAPIDPNARFERQKVLAKQEGNAEKQGAQEAVQRRFAAMGRLNSGAAVKNEQLVQKNAGDALSRRMQSIQDAEDTEGLRREEIQEGRKYQTSEREASQMFGRGEREASQMFGRGEREASQGFMSDQAKLGREFQTGERLGGQEFASSEAGKQRSFMTSERLGGQDFSSLMQRLSQEFQGGQNDKNRDLKEVAMATQVMQFNKQFKLDKRVTEFNMDMAKAAANSGKRQGWQKVFDPLGIFGAGLGDFSND